MQTPFQQIILTAGRQERALLSSGLEPVCFRVRTQQETPTQSSPTPFYCTPLCPPIKSQFSRGWHDREKPHTFRPRAPPSPMGQAPQPPWWGLQLQWHHHARWAESKEVCDGSGRQSHAGHGGLPASPPLLSAAQICCCQVTPLAIVKTVNFSSECFN